MSPAWTSSRRRSSGCARARLPIYEPGLEPLVTRNVDARAAAFHHQLRRGAARRRLYLHRRQHAHRSRTATAPTCRIVESAARSIARASDARRHHRQQEHDAGRQRRSGLGHRPRASAPTSPAGVGRLQSGVPARRLGGARLPAARPCRARLDGSRGGVAGRRALPASCARRS